MGITNEEAIDYFKKCNENLVSVAKDENVYDYEKQVIEADCMRRTFEANEKAIQALEQQHCEDCISREAIKEMLTEEWTKYMPMEMDVNLSFVLEKISELPSVIPQPKTGKWIKPNTEPWIKMGEGFTPYECSECEAVEFKKSKYCPNCGAKMEVAG